MDEKEKAQIRITCISNAIKLKQLSNTSNIYKNRDVIEIAKELEKFIMSK